MLENIFGSGKSPEINFCQDSGNPVLRTYEQSKRGEHRGVRDADNER